MTLKLNCLHIDVWTTYWLSNLYDFSIVNMVSIMENEGEHSGRRKKTLCDLIDRRGRLSQ